MAGLTPSQLNSFPINEGVGFNSNKCIWDIYIKLMELNTITDSKKFRRALIELRDLVDSYLEVSNKQNTIADIMQSLKK